MTDTTDAPLSRTPARFFFESGFFGCYAEATVRNGNKPPFDLTDAALDRAWEIAREAHPSPAEFDHELHRADSADQQLREAEAAFRVHFAADRETTGSLHELATGAHNLRHFGAELFPANRDGQAAFIRVVMDAVANTITAGLALDSVEAAVERMRTDPFSDDAHLLGTAQQDARMEHYARCALTPAIIGAQAFIGAIIAAAPEAEPVIVQYNPDGSGWTVFDRARHPARFFAETPTDDTRALVIAARKVAYGTIECADPDDLRTLDRALERYALSIAWDDEPQPANLPPLHVNNAVIDQIAARIAKADGLVWEEVCGFDTDDGECDSSTCIAAHCEDHDVYWSRRQYRRYARAALGIAEPAPVACPDAATTQRFNPGDVVSHNAGMIDAASKRQIGSVIGYDRDGGVQYRLTLPDGTDQGMAYDCELDPWPSDDAFLPMTSPRASLFLRGDE